MSLYQAELRVPRRMASFHAVQGFIAGVCESLAVPSKERYALELAIEEGMTQLFAQSGGQDPDELLRIRIQLENDEARVTVLAPGRPLDVRHLPVYSPAAARAGLDGIEGFLMGWVADSIQWRYVEKEGQELTMIKRLPSPILEQYVLALPEQAPALAPVGEISYRALDTEQEALAVSVCAYDIYRYAYKDVIYHPGELLARNRSGLMRSWIAIDEAGTVLGHYALIKMHLADRIAEMGAAFVRPEARGGGVFARLCEVAHAAARALPLAGLFSLSVTNHLATQKTSERMGRRTVGLMLASSPAIFVEGARPGERITTALNYQSLAPRASRLLYLPAVYQEQLIQSYGWLGLSIRAASPPATLPPGRATCDRDLTWNRAVIEVTGGLEAAYKLRAYTELLLEQGVASILLRIDLEDPGAPLLTEQARSLGFCYAGILPESLGDGHDALILQLLNGVRLDPAEILLHMDSAKQILAWIQDEAPGLFQAAQT
ncbi:MAG: hypothetical protein EOM91_07810 [Sphingobacteriia bacterium]|nr:hypothetical protein [Sphingobacteriia bacterium]NCC40027.1 hypothetical protein [Gammaproteobacteria bacterium]